MPAGNPARYSRHTTEALDWADPWRDPETVVERLLEFARRQPERPVLFYDGDWDLLLISRHRDRLRDAFSFVVPDAALVERLVDKASFQALSEELDLPVPRAHRVTVADARAGKSDLAFPALAKPLTRQHATWRSLTNMKAVHLEAPADLTELGWRLGDGETDLLIQEVVPGPESRIESYHVYIDDSGELAGEFTGRKLRTYPRGYGYSTRS